nr:fatty acid desaturase [Sulfurimonas sp. SAG-AH-194-C21]
MAEYTDYKDVNQEQLQVDIDEIKKTIKVGEKDFQHLLKLERWGRFSTLIGAFMIATVVIVEALALGMSQVIFWLIGLTGVTLMGIGNIARWANVTHPILHGAYDKVPNIPFRYTKKGFAAGNRRWLDWFDWIKPDAWAYEHNIMHHYHLGELDDPDNVEKDVQWIHDMKVPVFVKYTIVFLFATVWKIAYYGPNTLRILENKERIAKGLEPTLEYELWPTTKNGRELWKSYILPYGLFRFAFIPLLFSPLGMGAVSSALVFMLLVELYANLHSFLVIVPNHSAEDIYQFSTPHKTQGEFYLRQIMGSVNYNTGNDVIDYLHGFLNYQIEHHLFPNMPLSFYQEMQPIVKEICKKHNLEYRQESVFKRMGMTLELMVGKTKVLRIDGI